jgi:hypothetical protein
MSKMMHLPHAGMSKNLAVVEFRILHSEPFTVRHFHFLIIVELPDAAVVCKMTDGVWLGL